MLSIKADANQQHIYKTKLLSCLYSHFLNFSISQLVSLLVNLTYTGNELENKRI